MAGNSEKDTVSDTYSKGPSRNYTSALGDMVSQPRPSIPGACIDESVVSDREIDRQRMVDKDKDERPQHI